MSLLDKLPDRCTIRRRVRTKDELGGSKDSYTDEQTEVECWEQQTGASGGPVYDQKGMQIASKMYFVEHPGVSARHQIVVTSRSGVAIAEADRVVLDVSDMPSPDVSIGRGLLWRVAVGFNEAEE